MDLTQLANLGEFIGGVAVIGSLMFVGFQIRSNTRTLRASSTYDAVRDLSTLNRTIAADQQRAHIMAVVETSSDGPLDRSELEQMHYLVRDAFQHVEGQMVLVDHGIMDREIWNHRVVWARRFATSSVGSEWWAREKRNDIFSREFVAVVDGGRS